MRIGVHSGSLLAGVIGEAKLQYDIWGTSLIRYSLQSKEYILNKHHFSGADVEIASRLEATGRPGFVHVSGRTLSNLNPSDYIIMSGTETARNDPMLESMSTYLLTDQVNRNSVAFTLEGVLSASSLDIKPVETVRSQRTSHMSMNEELREDFRNMPVGGFE